MAKSKLHTAFLARLKGIPLTPPWNLLDKNIPFGEKATSPYNYPLQQNSIPTIVSLQTPILEAVRCYTDNNTNRDYLLISTATISNQRAYYLEMKKTNGATLLASCVGSSVRISQIPTNDPLDHAQTVAMKSLDAEDMTALALVLLPAVLDIDRNQGQEKIRQTVSELENELKDLPNWVSKDLIPQLTQQHLYYLDAIKVILDQHMILDFGSDSSSAPEEVDASFFSGSKQRGAFLCQNSVNGWVPQYLETSGKRAVFVSRHLTIGDAKNAFSSYSQGRSWTSMEQLLIPQFPDDMPVMPEVLRFAKRICDTQSSLNPVVNVMWRAGTGYGKSTGAQQLACILNMPFLTFTCNTDTETQDFKSTIVPATNPGIALEADADCPAERPPYFVEAMAHLSSLPESERLALLNNRSFFSMAMFSDLPEMAEMLLGEKRDMDVDELCWLFSDLRSAFLSEEPLRKKLAAIVPSSESKKPEFVHVISNYTKAMVNGYIIEVQEVSRIRKPGVLVGLNEFNRPGAVIPLLDGSLARRHPKAICIMTDNVGYESCRAIDPSVIRRNGCIIDSGDLSKEHLIERARRNTGCSDEKLLNTAYNYWEAVRVFCVQNSVTEGSISPVEYECLVQALLCDGVESLMENVKDCVVSKATSDPENQRDILSALQALA
ncbi:MAG TPA: hypothetical protein IAC31_02210 [Candidatus Faecousia intestinigallinarum]|nr:hypothetical protein [Candidatus Faecousia intestinigallinarum]